MFDDSIICDGGSTDDTLAIAHEFGARVIAQDARYKNKDNTLRDFSGVRNQCLDAAIHDWFLYIDSDETISDELREDIRQIVSRPLAAGDPLVYRVPIGIMMDGRRIRYSSNFPGYQHRLFNRTSGARFHKPVHEKIRYPDGVPIGTLSHPWYVFTTRDEWHHYLLHTKGYRAQEAQLYATKSWGFFIRRIVLRGLRTCLGALGKSSRNYLLHGFSEAIPVRGELGRAVAPFCLMAAILYRKLCRASTTTATHDDTSLA